MWPAQVQKSVLIIALPLSEHGCARTEEVRRRGLLIDVLSQKSVHVEPRLALEDAAPTCSALMPNLRGNT